MSLPTPIATARPDASLLPRRLVPGDAVALVSPASTPSAEWIDWSVGTLESWGLEVRVGAHALDAQGILAGDDAARLADLNAALRDPAVRAVLTTRGGVGSMRLIPGVDVDALVSDPKLLVGFSDITALHQVWQGVGVPSLHGAVAGAHADGVRRLLMTDEPAVVGTQAGTLTAELTSGGRAEGSLAGGSLEQLARCVGVVDVPWDGRVLLLEANRASGLGMIERPLAQLALSGVLSRVAGVALGSFDEFTDHVDRGWTVLDVLRSWLDPLGVPVLGGLPLGHLEDTLTVPLGVPCTLDADAGTLTVSPGVR
ncbi:S66 peptidase family protein [Beutenbergia cavernae]|uniref:S66 peptidase family protein n=1 Tax=Beutenbergia cavernae TaxID=84757 RepID=UPI0003208D96|nr:LD-carboxypeptidase [Beutenbergia cavernae]